jgi:hypothetical protein
MKRKILVICLALLFSTPAFAELTVDDAVSPDYMKNNATQKVIAQNNGEALEEPVEKEYYNKPVVKFVRRVFMYIDPSLDDHSFENDHDIKISPQYNDL